MLVEIKVLDRIELAKYENKNFSVSEKQIIRSLISNKKFLIFVANVDHLI